MTPRSAAASSGGKGRPTPKRKVAEAANKRPLVPDDRTARGEGRQARAKQRRTRREYQAMQTGDEKHLPAKDRGPVRRYMRDFVDARWNLGEFFLPVAFVFLVVQTLFGSQVATLALFAILARSTSSCSSTIVDAFIMWRGAEEAAASRSSARTPSSAG